MQIANNLLAKIFSFLLFEQKIEKKVALLLPAKTSQLFTVKS